MAYEKYNTICQLSKSTEKRITQNADEWKNFLYTAGKLYKYPFREQMLIHAQRPDATACASIEIWNKHMHCWVNRGAKGIALIDESVNKPRLKYVFDISDVHKDKSNGRYPKPWKVMPEHEQVVLDRLERIYGGTDNALSFVERIKELSERIAEESYPDIVSDMQYDLQGSFLEELDEINLGIRIRETLAESTAYSILAGCGMDMEQYQDDFSFEYIKEFSTTSTLNLLGNAVNEQSKSVLLEISRAVRVYEREAQKEEQRTEESQKGLANETNLYYNEFSTLKHESEGRNADIHASPPDENKKTENKELEGDDYGTEIQMGRRLSGAGSRDGRAAGGRIEEVRANEKAIFEGEQERNIQRTSDVKQIDAASVRSSGTGRGADRRTDGRDRGRERGTEGTRSDALGAKDEQHQALSGRNRVGGNHILSTQADTNQQLNLFPSVEEQIGMIEAAESGEKHTASAAFSVPEETFGQNVQKLDEAGQISFYVAECMEFPSMGEFHENLTLEEALKIYDTIPAERLNAVKGIGFDLQDGSSFAGQFELMSGGEVIKDIINEIPYYRDSPLVQKAIADMEALLTERQGKTFGQNVQKLESEEHLSFYVSEKMEFEAYGVHKENLTLEEAAAIYETLPEKPDDGTLVGFGQTRVGKGIGINFHCVDERYGGTKDVHFPLYVGGVMDVAEAERIPEVRKSVLVQQAIKDLQHRFPDTEITRTETHISGDLQAIPSKENFRITDDSLGTGSAKEKFRANMDAIQILKTCEEQGRSATEKEQEILSHYVGWGGLADAFDDTKSAWNQEYHELKTMLTEEEYRSARESTLNAHYTSPAIIRGIYDTLERMGFDKGNILEPSMGIGNFFGMLPETMRESRLYGVELDSLTGRIAKQLYPQANVQITGYENTTFPNDFFDVAVGNVPFGQYKINDKQYNKHNFLVHDYFFAKTLDQVRPGGIMAFVTSKGTMDKQNDSVRRYLAQRAELLGAVRLPNTAFKENAGTEVTSDILFFQKRDRLVKEEPEWLSVQKEENGIEMNAYFASHPEQIVGHMELVSGPYGMESTCVADAGRPFEEQLRIALGNIQGKYETIELEEDALGMEMEDAVLPADPDVKNFSYTVVNDTVYYRENSVMRPEEGAETKRNRIKGMVAIRDCTRELIDMQLEEAPDIEIVEKQKELNERYDSFAKKFGRINSRTNKTAFSQDSSYSLLCSLERFDADGNYKGKADMFSKRTIRRAVAVTSVDTATEALAVSLSERAKVDTSFMARLCGKTEKEVAEDLQGVIFKNPLTEQWETADEYLSGNVREKLLVASKAAKDNPEYQINEAALERVLPKDLDASGIEVRIGATWIEPKYYEKFMAETFQTPSYMMLRHTVGVQYSEVTGQWNVKGKNEDRYNPLVNATYGTERVNAYKILEDSLNLKESRVYDTVLEDGREKRVLNKKETTLASQKQEAIREAFRDWVFRDPERREVLVKKYNELFNAIRPREYDGAHLQFPGMSPEITLRPHQKNAVAHQLYGNNTLLAHCVGAGKTWEMTAAAMESKRLGLCRKSMFVVPNHLTEQWGSDFLQLYPGANILVATKKDFEPANRKKFCSRIATGDYDAVIIGHTQFEKIPLSKERQEAIIQDQIDEIENAIATAKAERGERYTIKQMEKSKKSLTVRLEKLHDASRKDDVVTFEQLGVDRLFVDESQNYKNLFLYTKMRNVAGIAQTDAQKSSDMFAKCQYMDELTGGKGITFATGTPISNSMTELYTNMRYLQFGTLQKMGLSHFDSWASSFGETQTAIELAPEGTGYRAKTRFSKFFNLPELISVFKECADIQTPDMLKLDVPDVEYENVVLKPSEFQKEIVESLAERAEKIRNNQVDSKVDNMLKVTNDGRKLALDQRLINDMLPENENSKANACVKKAFQLYQEEMDNKGVQLIFCDLSTPKNDGTFNVYDDLKKKLIEKGVPESEIAFIHDANTEVKKAELFAKARSGQVRFLLGSTPKMGAGTNVQDRLIALHHLDVPWRPSDLEQQEGRIIRQGNMYKKLGKPVKIFRYVTENTFDSYSWQVIENKQKFIGQIMTSKSPVRSCEDVDEAALNYAEVKALCTGNPYIKEKMDLDIQVSKLKLLKANYSSQKYRLEDEITKEYPAKIAALKEAIKGCKSDMALLAKRKEELRNRTVATQDATEKEPFEIRIGNTVYTERKEAGAALISMCQNWKQIGTTMEIGEYMGFKLDVDFDAFSKHFTLNMKGELSHRMDIGADPIGNVMRMNHVLSGIGKNLEQAQIQLETTETRLEAAKVEVTKPFQQEQELSEKLDRLNELNALLNMDETGAAHEEKEQTVENKRENLLDAEGKTQTEKKQILSLSDRIAHKQGQIDAKGAEQRCDMKQKKQLER